MSETPPNTLQHRFDGPEDAPVLILGPSLGATWHMWDRQTAELSARHRVLRFDLPGHGGAPAHAVSSVAGLTGRLLATLDALGVQRFGYAGAGIGAAVGADLALRAPQRLAALALVGASPRFGTADEYRQRGVVVRAHGMDPMARTAPEQWFTPAFAAAQPAIADWAVQMVRTTDPGCYIAACEALAAFDVRADLPRVGVPTLVLVGSDDRVAGPAAARTLVAGIPDARLAVVPPAHVPTPAAPPAAHRADPYGPGLRLRREVLGDAHVDAALDGADDLTRDFQELVTRYAWGEVWSRDGLDRRTRSSVALTALTAGGHLDELAVHTRAALRNGLTPTEIREILLQAAVYCGVPAANAAFRVAARVIRQETTLGD
ncbi:alpha/beta fold hydrolase [Streptomyces fradiae]|uniref:bifunctional 3-oxoadipate enol-lactonase/4-carboxymuconolactone decarboxylase PcaDC n=1 Tax=Streptomyces fradiae TaxID=1906 RepID=UPI0036BD1AD2